MKTLPSPVLKTTLALALAFAGAGSLFAQVDPNIMRHFRSLKHREVAPAAEAAPAEPAAVAPTRPEAAVADNNALFPPNAKPGECYTRVLVTPAMESVTERVVKREEGFELIEVPAVLSTVEERVMVRGASERQEIIPATYKEVEERVLKSPAYTRQIPVAAVYETRTERVLVKPERSYWKKGSGSLQKIDGETGEIMCYVTDPAVYDTVTRNVLVSAATTREEQVPAVYETVKRTVVDQPAQVKTIQIPAEYKMVKVQKVTSPARVEKKVIPAEYGTVTRQVAAGKSHMEWRRILCATNVTPDVIASVQTALNTRNFNVGTVDGVYGKSTQQAVASFQAANNLPQGGLTYETLAALGVTK
jgi:hypothetical protein